MAIHPSNPAPDTVGAIGQFMADELAGVTQALRAMLDSDTTMIREVGDYISLAGGKHLRPMVTLLAFRAYGGQGPAPIEVAAAMEAVHVATLLHDDVIDKAPLRRGRPSVNARWGDDVAILMADYLYSAAFDVALRHLDAEPMRLITRVTRRMCEGEMFQIERRGRWLTPDDYLRIISDKTAFLFAGCAALGGMTAGLPAEQVAALSAFGMDFGLAFQITDDALDLTASASQLGKPAGLDLQNGKQTLPIILTLEDAAPEDRRRLQAALSEGRDYDFVHDLLDRHRAIERALDAARNYGRQALTHLQGLGVQDENACEFLHALPDYVIGRQR